MIPRLPFLFMIIFLPLLFIQNVHAQQGKDERSDPPHEKQISNNRENKKLGLKTGEDQEISPYGFQRLQYDLRYLFQSPGRPHKDDLPKIFLFMGATTLIYAGREDIRETVIDNTTKSRKQLYDDARISGKGAFAPGLALIFFTLGQIRDTDYELETAQIILESAALSAITAAAGSFVISSERPRDGDEVNFFQSGGHGFSLDVALSSSFVFPIIDRYLKIYDYDSGTKKTFKYVARVFLFSLPILTALQRMSSDSHWASDVFLGATAGFTIGKILSNAHKPKRYGRLNVSFSGSTIRFQF